MLKDGYKFYLLDAVGGPISFQFFEIARLGLQNRIGGAESNRPLNLPMAKARGFPFSLRYRLRGSLAYRVQGRFMRPAH